jgi:hypothetical protein
MYRFIVINIKKKLKLIMSVIWTFSKKCPNNISWPECLTKWFVKEVPTNLYKLFIIILLYINLYLIYLSCML